MGVPALPVLTHLAGTCSRGIDPLGQSPRGIGGAVACASPGPSHFSAPFVPTSRSATVIDTRIRAETDT